MYHGDIRLGDTIDIKFTTRNFSTGAPFTLAGTPSIAAYLGNSTTEVTAGITLTVDFDARTGLNNVRVVASGANGYATATNYTLVITAGTVNGVSVVGECIGSFSIEARSALMPATAGRTAVVDAAGLIDATAVKLGPSGSGTAQTARDIGASVLLSSGTGTGQLDFTSGVVKSNLVQILATALTETAGQIAAAFKQFFDVASPTGTMKAITNVVTTTNLTTNNDKTGYSVTGLTPATVHSDLDDIQSRLPAALVGGRMDANVGSVDNAVITAAKFAAGALDAVWSTATRVLTAGTNIVLAKGTGVTGFNDLSGPQVKTQVVDALNTDTYAEPGQEAPPATTTLVKKIGYLYKAWRNKSTQTGSEYKLFADDAATVDQKSTVSDDGNTFTSGEKGVGP